MKILDMCCGGKMFWWDKDNPIITFMDKREFDGRTCDNRILKVAPDVVADFTDTPFPDDTFDLVVFDPPHLVRAGKNWYLAQKYWVLPKGNWREELKKGFDEGIRVLKPDGTLIFKWNEYQIKVSEIVKLFDGNILFWNRTSKNTFWIVYKK